MFTSLKTTGLVSFVNGSSAGLLSYEDSTGSTTLLTIENLSNSSVYVADVSGVQQVLATNQSGTYQYLMPSTAFGTWRAVVKALGYTRKVFSPIADGVAKVYDGSLIQEIDFNGDPIYQGQSNSLITIQTNTPSAGFHKIDIGDGFVTGSEIYDMTEQTLMTSTGMASNNLDVAYLPTLNGNYLGLGSNVQLRRRTAGDDNAGVNAIVSQTNGIPVDGTNGPVAILSAPDTITAQDIRDAMALALGIGETVENTSIDEKLQKIRNSTSAIPGML
jgi:hypothetical protein